MLTKSQSPRSLNLVVKPHCTPTQPCLKCALLLVIRFRFNAFREQFGREPKPTEPLFFDRSRRWPTKASLADVREQIETAAAAVGVKAARVLQFLRLDSPISEKKTHRMGQNPVKPVINGARSRAWANRPRSKRDSPWERFARNERLHRLHKITPQELKTLLGIAMMGEIRSSRELLYILKLIREQMEPA